ncbi:MAG: DUF2807 domain-containing protein [Bacteroidales bacterium]|nr:DUF2807 domain-containing protein [Bacteroidales bacterium]
MKKLRIISLFIIFLSASAFAQKTKEIKLNPFHSISVTDNVMVQLIKGTEESIKLSFESIEADKISTTVINGILSIKLQSPVLKDVKVRATLTYKNIKNLAVSSLAEVSADKLFQADSLFLNLKSGGKIYISLDVKYLTASITENALVSADGYADVQNISVTTSGTFSGYELEGEKVMVKATTGGKAKINVEKELQASVTTKGYVSYKGNPSKKNLDAKLGGLIEAYKE